MTNQEQLEKSLRDIKKLTGLQLRVEGFTEKNADEAEQAIKSLNRLVKAYREQYDKTGFFRSILLGKFTKEEIYDGVSRFHLQNEVPRILFVVEVESKEAENAKRILKEIFISGSGDLAFRVDERHLALIKERRESSKKEDPSDMAHTIVDMLNTEAMVKAYASYSDVLPDLFALTESYRRGCLAIRIGRIFDQSRNVMTYDKLGIGRLIYNLPEDTARRFLKEVLGDSRTGEFDDETVRIINAFFDNNLNISETARKLFLHRNTLVYRLEKIHQLTGLDLREFDEAMELKIAMMVENYLRALEKENANETA